MRKLGYIDALRGFAILAVLMVHCFSYGENDYPEIFESIVGNGGRGVQLFFVVSAFTLYLSMSHRIGKEQSLYSNFFIRRFFRIAPLFYLAIVYNTCERLCWGNLTSGHLPDITWGSLVASFTFLHGLSPYWINNIVPGGWSIAAEMMFYCFVPLLFRYVNNLNKASIAFIVAIVFQHVSILLLKQISVADSVLMKYFLFCNFTNHLPVFMCGIFLYFLIYTPREDWNIHPFILFTLSCSVLFQIATGKAFFSQHIIFAIGFVILAYALSKREFVLLVNPITRFIGKISFSMYFVHFTVLHWMNKYDFLNFVPLGTTGMNIFNFCIRYFIMFAFTVAISYVSYRLIELPFQSLGRKIIKRKEVKALN